MFGDQATHSVVVVFCSELLLETFIKFPKIDIFILQDHLSSIIDRCTLYTQGCRMKANK